MAKWFLSESNHTLLERGKQLEFDVINIPAGIYFLQLIDMRNNRTIKKNNCREIGLQNVSFLKINGHVLNSMAILLPSEKYNPLR
jgi:hypothetical protein